MTFNLEIAKQKIDEYWQKNRQNPSAFIKLIEIEIDNELGEPTQSVDLPLEIWEGNSKLSELLYAVPGASEE